MTSDKKGEDLLTAAAFANSWNNLPVGSVYTYDQFVDWLEPISIQDVNEKKVLELGCGNGSLLIHILSWKPKLAVGVDLGDSVISATKNLANYATQNWKIIKEDLCSYNSEDKFDLVYCIGVLHHLKDPKKGFDSVIRNLKSGGKFHCWVYAREGNSLVVWVVDPIRKFASRLPWWITKYFIATPLVIPYFLYAKLLSILPKFNLLKKILPLYEYSLWIAKRGFFFFRHVAFDQLVTPQTIYIKKRVIEDWLKSNSLIDPSSCYIIFRNGNSWKFGGQLK